VHLPLSISIKPSRRFFAVLLFAHGLALIAVALLTLSIPMRTGLGALVLVSLLFTLRKRKDPGIVRLHLGAKGELEIEKIVGVRETAVILPETMVFPWMILLVIRSEGKRYPLVLLQDSTNGDDLRRLLVWLDWRASGSV
jgi:hypothetical protein